MAGLLLVSVLPRLRPSGGSAIVALDLATLQLLAVRRFPPHEYLGYAPDGHQPIQHCRGLAVDRGDLLVAMFNAVRRYAIVDSRRLILEPRERLSHHGAVDLHGIMSRGDRLWAASTGTECVISWPVRGGAVEVLPLKSTPKAEFRFPMEAARQAHSTDWREVLPVARHINDVLPRGDGGVVVCSLREIVLLFEGRRQVLFFDGEALLHDGRQTCDGRLLFTDAARGDLLLITPGAGETQRIRVSDPRSWFVRGMAILPGDQVVVLRSERGPTRQRAVQPEPNEEPGNSLFGVSIVDLAAGTVVYEETISDGSLSAGIVAYAAVALP
jgi:hypothetical protein